MNRAQRRKQGVKAQPKTYTLTDQQIEKIKQDAVLDALRTLLAVPVLVLHDKFGFGEIRLNRFLGYVKTWVLAINKDESTLSEVLEAAQKECSFSLEFK